MPAGSAGGSGLPGMRFERSDAHPHGHGRGRPHEAPGVVEVDVDRSRAVPANRTTWA
jgi:hypothetical protein